MGLYQTVATSRRPIQAVPTDQWLCVPDPRRAAQRAAVPRRAPRTSAALCSPRASAGVVQAPEQQAALVLWATAASGRRRARVHALDGRRAMSPMRGTTARPRRARRDPSGGKIALMLTSSPEVLSRGMSRGSRPRAARLPGPAAFAGEGQRRPHPGACRRYRGGGAKPGARTSPMPWGGHFQRDGLPVEAGWFCVHLGAETGPYDCSDLLHPGTRRAGEFEAGSRHAWIPEARGMPPPRPARLRKSHELIEHLGPHRRVTPMSRWP